MTQLDEECGFVSHAEAHELAQALIDHYFRNDKSSDFTGKRVNIEIPANPRRDTDLRLGAYIRQQEAREKRVEAALKTLRDAIEAIKPDSVSAVAAGGMLCAGIYEAIACLDAGSCEP